MTSTIKAPLSLIEENASLRSRLEMAEAALEQLRNPTSGLRVATPLSDAEKVAETFAATLKSFIVSAPVGIVVFDSNMRYVHINERLAESNGLSVQEHLGRTYKEIVPNLYEQTASIFDKVLREGVVVSDCIVDGETPKAPGVKRTWQVSWFPVKVSDGQSHGVGAIVQDITKQRRIEMQLRQTQATEQMANQRVVDLMESLTEGLCVFDQEFRVTYINHAGEKINNLSRKELLGRTQWEVYPDSIGTNLEHQFRRAMTERVTIELENYYARSDTWHCLKLYPAAEGGLCVLFRDITQSKQQASARHKADERFRRVFDTQTVGMIEWDFDLGLITSANSYFLEMLGYSQEDMSAGRINFRTITPPEWTELNEERIAQIRKEGSASAYEKEYFRKDGTRVPILIAGVCFEGSTHKGMSVIVDLSNTRQVEAELRSSEGRFRAAVGLVSSILWTNNAEGLMVGEQTSWAKFTGQKQDSYQGVGWLQAIHPDDASLTIKAWQNAVCEKKVFEFEHRVRRHDGQWRVCSVRAVPVFDSFGKNTEWVGVHADITRQRQAQTKMKDSEVRYRRLFESAKDGILILDAHTGKITDANPFIAEMLGYSHHHFLGMELWQIGLFRDVEASKEAMRELQKNRYIRYEDLPLETQAGQRLNVEFVSNVYGQAGDTVIQCNIRDISDRKQLEESLRQHAAQLLAADQRKNEFLATLAHELRNPLAPIRNGLQIMRLAGNDAAAIHQCLGMMERQLEQMVHLVDDLLDVSRISLGKLELRKQRVELAVVLDNAVETCSPLINANGHTLAIALPSEPVFLDADLTRLGQVFSNLLNNAAKYSNKGAQIKLTAQLQGSEVAISVMDSGIGIAADMLPLVFEMFTQADRALEKSQGGLGIGLSLVKQLVELHGGSVQASSKGNGMGSEFVVRLPIAMPVIQIESQNKKPLGNKDKLAPKSSRRRILVADDNADAATSLATFLKLLGYEVQTALDGQEAVEVAAQFQPDFILLDIGMPKLNGYDACRRIREQLGSTKPFLIALTGWGQNEDRQRSLEAGFDHHLVKPVDPDALEQLLAGLQIQPNPLTD